MKITLRKASVLQNNIQEVIKAISPKATVALNEFQDFHAVMAESKNTVLKDIDRLVNLNSALASIRSAIGTANVQSGVNDKLATSASLDRLVAIHENLVLDTNIVEDEKVIQGKLTKLGATPQTYHYGDSNVTVGVLEKADIDTLKGKMQSYKKQKQVLNDEILELNIRTEITLSQDIIDTLTAENII